MTIHTKNIKMFIGIFFTLSIFNFCGNNKLLKFQKVEIKADKFHYSNDALTAQETKGVLQVLSYYDVKYEQKNTDILIPAKVYKDTELMYNYTQKATDLNWLKNHSTK